MGIRGVQWTQVELEAVEFGWAARSLVILVIHVGDYHLCTLKTLELLALMWADLESIPIFFRDLVL